MVEPALLARLKIPALDRYMPGLWFCECPPGINLPALIVVLCYGYSFTGVERKIFGAIENEEDAMAALRREFYFCDDFETKN
jgi:hypothetical protein